jgi:hypothetical protein
MPLKAYWAYDFLCDRPLESLLALFNEAGPWQWEMRESAWYGDYLNARPSDGVRVRIHEYPQTGEGGVFVGLRDKGFSALLQIEADSPATQAEIDQVFRELLTRAPATGITEIEPYD